MRKLTIGILLALAVSGTSAHELMENRATLVLRDANHLSATLYIHYAEMLHRALAPAKKYQEFLVEYAAMRSEDFQRELVRAQSSLQSRTKIFSKDGADLPIGSWRWPNASEAQNSIRERAKHAMINPASHSHERALEIHADLSTQAKIQSVAIQFPAEFQNVLVVSYRPNQIWVEKNAKSKMIAFRF